jgi:hypothetical protein
MKEYGVDFLYHLWPNKTPTRGVWDIFYGFDYTSGYFIQFFPKDDIAEGVCLKALLRKDDPIDIDSLFDKMTGVHLGYFLEKLRGDCYHINCCYLDIPF